MDVRQRPEELVYVELDFENRHRGLHLVEESRCPVDRLRNELLDEVQVQLVFLFRRRLASARAGKKMDSQEAHPFSIRVVEGFQLFDVGVSYDPHDLQLSVLREGVSGVRTATGGGGLRALP